MKKQKKPPAQFILSVAARLFIVLEVWYAENDCGCEARYDREDDPRVMDDNPLGVLGMVPVVVVRAERAVSGVGAPICDFFGVSVDLFLLELLKVEEEPVKGFPVPELELVTLFRLPASTKSWRSAA